MSARNIELVNRQSFPIHMTWLRPRVQQAVCALRAGRRRGDSRRARATTACFPSLRRVTIALVDDRTIRRLNRLHRHEDRATDVLAYPALGLGEADAAQLVASVQTARREARKRRIPVRHEVLRYLVHGLLHLAGARDDSACAAAAMWARQENMLQKLLK